MLQRKHAVNLAFCLFRYFPHGGMQRDFLRIALACRERGHRVRVLTTRWEGEIPDGFEISIISPAGWSNHARMASFGRKIAEELTGRGGGTERAGMGTVADASGSEQAVADVVIGFNKLPGLDLYFAADSCLAARNDGWNLAARWTPRRCCYLDLERTVFAPGLPNKSTRAKTHSSPDFASSSPQILVLTPAQQENYHRAYDTEPSRFHLLPPGISRDREWSDASTFMRKSIRQELGILESENVLLMIGSGFRTKGLDRSIRALAALPFHLQQQCKLIVAGRGEVATMNRLARRLNVADRVRLLGGRDDIPRLLFGADLLLQPSRVEAAGMAIVEAIAAGLPVLATEACGYAFHVRDAANGHVIPAPFEQSQMNSTLREMLESGRFEEWRANALAYAARTDLFSLPEQAAQIIESVGLAKRAARNLALQRGEAA